MGYYFDHANYLKPAEIGEVYQMLCRQRVQHIMFYDGGVQKKVDFIKFMLSPYNWMVRVQDEDRKFAGMFWLNGFQGRAAQIHFCVGRDREDKLAIGLTTMTWIYKQEAWDSLYGVTPKPYKNVFEFSRELGFVQSGELPGACYMAQYNKHVPGIISVLDLNLYKEVDNGRKSCSGDACTPGADESADAGDNDHAGCKSCA